MALRPRLEGRNRNTTPDGVVSSSVTVTRFTSVKVADENEKRLFFHINNNDTNRDFWVKLQPAATDNDRKGIMVQGRSFWEMPTDNIYTGEICVIADSFLPVQVYVTEY